MGFEPIGHKIRPNTKPLCIKPATPSVQACRHKCLSSISLGYYTESDKIKFHNLLKQTTVTETLVALMPKFNKIIIEDEK